MNIDELKQLRDRITPGPWLVNVDESDVDATYIYTDDGMLCMSLNPIGSGSSYARADLDLAALAPELLDEVIRLREAIDRLQRHTRMQSGFNCLASDIADALHIILEGDHDA